MNDIKRPEVDRSVFKKNRLKDIIAFYPLLTNSALLLLALTHADFILSFWPIYVIWTACFATLLFQFRALAHEASHGNLLGGKKFNRIIGVALDSLLLHAGCLHAPAHLRHHRYAHHITKDTQMKIPQDLKNGFFERVVLPRIPTDVLKHASLFLGFAILIRLTYAIGAIKEAVDGKDERSMTILNALVVMMIVGLSIYSPTFALIFTVPCFFSMGYMLYMGLPDLHSRSEFYDDDTYAINRASLSIVDFKFPRLMDFLHYGFYKSHVAHHFYPSVPFYNLDAVTESVKKAYPESYKVVEGNNKEILDAFLFDRFERDEKGLCLRKVK